MGSQPTRPTGVVTLATVVILAGVILTVLSVLMVRGGVLVLGTTGNALLLALGLVFLLLSLLLLVAGFGLRNLRPWARALALVVLVLHLVMRVGDAILAKQIGPAIIIGFVLPLLVLVYLIAVREKSRPRPTGAR